MKLGLRGGFAGLLFLFNIAAATIIVFGTGGVIDLGVGLLYFSFIMFSFIYARMLFVSSSTPLYFSLLIYFGYAFVLPGLYQVATGNFFWISSVRGYEYEVGAAFIIFLAVLAMCCVELYSPQREVDNKDELAEVVEKEKLKWGFSSLVVSIVSFVYSLFILRKFGPEILFLPRGAVSAIIANQFGEGGAAFGLIKTLGQGLAIGSLATSFYVLVNCRRRNIAIIIALLLSVISNAIVNFPLAVPRFYLVAIVFVIMFSAYANFFQKYKVLLGWAIPVSMFLIFPILGRFNRGDEFESNFDFVSFGEYLTHGDLDGYQSLMNVVHYVGVFGISWGHGLLSSLLFFVPRGFWEEKASPTGQAAAENAAYHFTNISMPLPGELYSNFGYAGVFLGMLCIVRFIHLLDVRFERVASNPGVSMLTIVFAAYMPIIFRGSLLSTIQGFACSVAAILLWVVILKFKFKYSH
ncbi:hypothetical protein [Zhongshania marina]|uniref:Oligosaccharide repeat unit polymerase n=1 Tax=Zhongshania marina TaxID=2304603 RepID=A0ABX9W747_9GAMM|nr:hypothetical protein D0911_03050 [Zhongshania marina]